MKNTLLFILTLLCLSSANAQTICDSNIDFETGTYANWYFYTGTPAVDAGGCCPINTPTFTGLGTPSPGRHTLTSGAGFDPCCSFPVVSSGGGTYALKVGDSLHGKNAEKARFYIHVPATGSYNLIYRYAAVLQDPGHSLSDQPRMEIRIFDSATYMPVSTTSWVAMASLPGFYTVTTPPCAHTGAVVRCKAWTTETVNLSAWHGQTLMVDFNTGDCGAGEHFGYMYVDLTCGLFAIHTVASCDSPTAHLKGPSGFATYAWYDSTFTTSYGTADSADVPVPAMGTHKSYALIISPATGMGPTDTLFTTVSCDTVVVTPPPSHLGIAAANDNSADAKVYPNPATNELTIVADAFKYNACTIRNAVGQELIRYVINNNRSMIDINSLPIGMYLVELVGADHLKTIMKVVKQ